MGKRKVVLDTNILVSALGWKVWQRLDGRIDTAIMCKGVWHSPLWSSSDT